jgi:hypothetical protein
VRARGSSCFMGGTSCMGGTGGMPRIATCADARHRAAAAACSTQPTSSTAANRRLACTGGMSYMCGMCGMRSITSCAAADPRRITVCVTTRHCIVALTLAASTTRRANTGRVRKVRASIEPGMRRSSMQCRPLSPAALYFCARSMRGVCAAYARRMHDVGNSVCTGGMSCMCGMRSMCGWASCAADSRPITVCVTMRHRTVSASTHAASATRRAKSGRAREVRVSIEPHAAIQRCDAVDRPAALLIDRASRHIEDRTKY